MALDNCFICGSERFKKSSSHYQQCLDCGHEVLDAKPEQGMIINDHLSYDEIIQQGRLDQFKLKVLQDCAKNHDFLMDVGAASGKFLYHSQHLFEDYVGIEIVDECVNFARQQLKLNVVKEPPESLKKKLSVATFWHSLEHIPTGEIEKIFQYINSNSSDETRVIISVPNSDSLQYQTFGEKYAFYDVPNHLHQFSNRSLDLLMQKYGYEEEKSFYSFAYSSFGYIQGFLNYFNPQHNYFYYRKKRGWTYDQSKSYLAVHDLMNILLSGISIPLAVMGSIYDHQKIKRGGVITKCYQKKR